MHDMIDRLKEQIISLLREDVPEFLWIPSWWLAPLSAIVMLPLGTLVLEALLYLDIDTVRPMQVMWLFALAYGPAVGLTVLFLVGKAGLPISVIGRVKWLARFAVISPILFLFIMFQIARLVR